MLPVSTQSKEHTMPPPSISPRSVVLSFVLAVMPAGCALAENTDLEKACPQMVDVKTEIIALDPPIEERPYTCQVFIAGEIGSDLVDATDDIIFFCPRQENGDPGQALIRVQSPGGSVAHQVAFTEAMAYRGDSLHAVVVALPPTVASAAVDIVMAGDERYALPSTTFVLHGPSWSPINLSTDELVVLAEQAKAEQEQDIGFMQHHTGMSETCATYLVGRDGQDTILTAEQALGLGIIDGVLRENGAIEVRVGAYETRGP
jgi:ATP-dependent protease ClpP protease subunit